MPPKAELPDGFVQRHSDKMVRCTICHSEWMLWTSIRKHQTGKEHLGHVSARDSAKKNAQLLADLYTANTEPSANLESVDEPPSPPRPVMDPSNDPLPDFNRYLREYNVDPSAEDIEYATALLLQAREQTVQAFEERYRTKLKDLASELMQMTLRDEPEVDEHDATVAAIAQDLREAGIPDNLSAESVQALFENRDPAQQEWFPYPNKTMFFIDLLDSLPRLRLSDAHMKMILFVLLKCGARDVPSFYALRKCQELLREKSAPSTVKHQSVHGNVFYSNDIRDTIAMIVPHFHPYPELEPNGISESWEASRWREIP
ncbi:hypothetical protein AURDEDRAFT_124427 [Auricularia subglabra TFB-10046 SS5]|nr:hypothetical protein AURDEDRAFT_124427 [Auricularia subglabra TFB-10046 SS5]